MIRAQFRVALLLLFASRTALGQTSHSPEAKESVRPCASHLVNGRMCVHEEVLRGLLMRYVAPKLPAGANKNGEVILHVMVPPSGGKAGTISVVSGDPMLARSAIRAVRDWIFMAYEYKHAHVAIEGDLHISFKAAE
jgi:Gram-negative bacterial TonB protein C-terminal